MELPVRRERNRLRVDRQLFDAAVDNARTRLRRGGRRVRRALRGRAPRPWWVEHEAEDCTQSEDERDRRLPAPRQQPPGLEQPLVRRASGQLRATLRDSVRLRPQMSFSRSSTLALPRARTETRSVFLPADRFPNVFETSVALPRRTRTRAVARSAIETRTVTAPRLAVAVNPESSEAAQRSNAPVTSTGAAMVRAQGFLPLQAPPQPRKRERPFGVARSVIVLPRG